MNVYLDDERVAPEGWIQCRWSDEVIELLKTGNVKQISLDHDLGDDDRGTGYDVVKWLEEAVIMHDFVPPVVTVHSANPSAVHKMMLGLDTIRRYRLRRSNG